MTRDETRFLLARISRCWGRPTPDVATLEEWTRALTDVDVELAQHELNCLVQRGVPGPSLAEFVAVCRAAHRAALVTPNNSDDWEGPTERGRQLIADIRDQLAPKDTRLR